MRRANLSGRTVLARNIREFASRQSLSLNILADLAGVSSSQLYDVLSCRKAATIDWMENVADALGVGLSQLLSHADEPEPRRSGDPGPAAPLEDGEG